jgi:cytochrome c-type biogenesis protein CcmH
MRAPPLVALVCVALTLVSAALPALDTTVLADPKLQARYLALTHELRCMQCQNESIADSPVDLAADLRTQVREQLLAGRSDAEIRNWMAARYGDFILFRPRYSWGNAWLWAAPAVLLALGAGIAFRILRTRTALVDADHEPLDDEPHS